LDGVVINRLPPENKRDLITMSNVQEIPRLAGVPLRAALPEAIGGIADDLPQALIDAMMPYAKTLRT
jgi:hypothetical protein